MLRTRVRARRSWALLLAATASACAAKTVPIPTVSSPAYPDFIQPAVPQALLAAASAAAGQERGWRFLQAGDLKDAQGEFETALRSAPGFYPAEASLGYLALARKDGKAALPHFERALAANGRYVPALVGGGQALVALGREADALFSFESALALDPSLAEVRRRVEVLKFRGLERDLAAARQALGVGKLDDAARAYASAIARSPDSAFLYRELATVEQRRGAIDAALDNLRKALALDPTDGSSLAAMGDLLEAKGDHEAAVKAYADSLTFESNATVEAKLEAVRTRIELARLPEEYRSLASAPEITRGDLAALIGVRLSDLVSAARRPDAVLLTDVRGHWAEAWITAVARAGVIDPFDNHEFQPGVAVKRTDLAQALSRLLARAAGVDLPRLRAWESARLRFSDLAPGHLAYPAASMAVAAGLMTVGRDNTFEPSKAVSAAEAIAALTRVDALAGGPARASPRAR